MCGILGMLVSDVEADSVLDKNFDEALSLLHHRGPDDNGCRKFVLAEKNNLYLGHTRLSILDLTEAGQQPMTMEDGSLTITFNGEIYNYKELREELVIEGYVFKTETDTEVLLKAFHLWGLAVLPRLIGMFSFCIYDRISSKITLVRDAFGIKPLFLTKESDRIIFSSEIPSLLELTKQQRRPDLQAAYDYLVHADYGSSERTFFYGVQSLMPASYIELDVDSFELQQPVVWWTPEIKEDPTICFEEAACKVRDLFLRSVKLHLRSDVAIGAALSGGIDSSSIVCAMRELEPDLPIHTFSYIAEGKKSEQKWVDLINDHVGAIGSKVKADPDELIRDLDDLICVQGEPFSTTSIYAQYRVFKLAQERGVTVTLDGQGADELLAGYIGYPGERLLSLWEVGSLRKMFSFARQWASITGRSYWAAWQYFGRKVLPATLYKHARKLLGKDFEPNWLNFDLLNSVGLIRLEQRSLTQSGNMGRRVIEQLRSSLKYRGLPTLLRHADRNSMSVSIESRVPFLTIELAEYLFSLPEEYLISNDGETKHIFRAAMRDILPKAIVERQDKIGFDMDSSTWARRYIEILSKMDKKNLNNFIDFDLATASFSECNEKFYWRLLNYSKWYNLFFDSPIEKVGRC